MLEAADLWLIGPIRAVFLCLLEQAYRLSGSYGTSLLLLSATFNVAVMPAWWWAENVRRLECERRNAMMPKLNELKHAFRGYERHMMVRFFYRQNNYRPVYVLRNLAPLAVQVPFFIAAYGLLSDYVAFEGQSFLIFSDLSRPDGLLDGVNLMPIAMTCVNVYALHVYCRNGSQLEFLQGLVVALLFLVLLYRSPVALVLYWTANNAISVLKGWTLHALDSRLAA